MEKKNLPNGWGDNDEDDDYGYNDFNDDDESDFPFKKVKESAPDISSGNTGLQDEQLKQEQSVGTQQRDTSVKPVQTNQSCQFNSAKKSKAVPILIAIIAVLAVAGGILAGILILKNKKAGEKEITVSESSDAEIKTNETSSGDSTSMTTETNGIQTEATEAVTESKTKETQPTSVSDTYSADEISAMFSAYISENPDPNRTYDNADYGYALIDLNNDGTQELLITEGEREKGSPWIIGVYTIKNSKLTLLMGFDLRFPGSLYEDNIISCFSSLRQGGGTAFYKYISGDSLDMIDIISYDYSSGTKVMYHNSDVITEAESYSILAQYKAIKFETKPLNINLQQTVNSSINTSKYTTYDTSAAPADMYFYQGDYYNSLGRKAIGVIATETDPLNLRPMPSIEVQEIAKMPKGTQVSVLGYNDEWCYVEYYSGSETFFGYASRQYIDVDVYQIGVG